MSDTDLMRRISYGTKFEYDPQWNGPMSTTRTTTDRNWCYYFILYSIIHLIVVIYAFIEGDLRKLDNRFDNINYICGSDWNVIDKPYVMHLNMKKDTRSYNSPKACVAHCPSKNFVYNKTEPVEEIKKKLICTNDVNVTSIRSVREIDFLISNDKCARWYLKSKPVLNNCIAYKSWKGHEVDTISGKDLEYANDGALNGKYLFKKIYRALKWIWAPILVALFISAILTLLCMVLLRSLAEEFFYMTLFCFMALLTILLLLMVNKLMDIRDSKKKVMWLLMIILLLAILIGIIVAVYRGRKKIHMACQLFEESTRAVFDLPATLVCPWVTSLFASATSVFFIMIFLHLSTITVPNYIVWNEEHEIDNNYRCYCNDHYYRNGDSCNPDEFNRECKNTCPGTECKMHGDRTQTHIYLFHIINFFSQLWVLFLISGMEFMVLGGTFATWYWSFEKNVVGNNALIKSLSRTVRYHLGTVIAGSFILSLVAFIKGALSYVLGRSYGHSDEMVNPSLPGNTHGGMIQSILQCLNNNAYIMCAVHGKNFMSSARSAFYLLMRNIMSVIVLHTVIGVLIFVAVTVVTLIVTAGQVYYLTKNLSSDNEDDVVIFVITLIVTIIGAAVISSLFFQVIDNAVQTIFLCFLEDIERNDGSSARPYYMSSKLQILLKR